MKIRGIRWYCKVDEMSDQEDQDFLSNRHVITYNPTIDKLGRYVKLFTDEEIWFCYSFLDVFRHALTREEFEENYLEWKAKNAG